MPENIDSVPWQTLQTAYEKGAELPKFLKKLSSRSEKVRGKALFDLREEIAHQGQIEPNAAAAVAPFLVELIEDPKTQGRARLCCLLGDLACWGSSFNYLIGPVPSPFEPIAHGVIDAHADLWRSLLESDEAGVAAAVALVVAFAGDPLPWLSTLMKATGATDALARTSALLALHVLARRGVDVPVAPFVLALSEDNALLKSAALIGIALLEPGRLTALEHAEATRLAAPHAPLEELGWADGHLDYWVAEAVAEAAAASGHVEVLWNLVDVRSGALPGPGYIAVRLAQAVLKPYSGPRLRRPEELEPATRQFLVELCRRSLVNQSVRDLVYSIGLFSWVPALRRLLSLEKQGPLDQQVEGEPLWRIFNDHLNGRLDFQTLANAVDASFPNQADLLSLLHDVATGYPVALEWPIPKPLPSVRADPYSLIVKLIDGRVAPEALSQELRQGRGDVMWVGALMGALAHSADADAIASDPAILAKFLDAADTLTAFRPIRTAVEAMGPGLRWRVLSKLTFYQRPNTDTGGVVYRGGWNFVDLVPAEHGADWVLDALEKCEPESIPIEKLALAELSFGAIWEQKVNARRSRLAPHQLDALERAHDIAER
jgi:hypothetical protein